MIQDLFPHLNEKYIQVRNYYFKSFKPILSLKSSVRRVCSNISSETVELGCSSVNSPITFSAIIDASSSLIFPTYKNLKN